MDVVARAEVVGAPRAVQATGGLLELCISRVDAAGTVRGLGDDGDNVVTLDQRELNVGDPKHVRGLFDLRQPVLSDAVHGVGRVRMARQVSSDRLGDSVGHVIVLRHVHPGGYATVADTTPYASAMPRGGAAADGLAVRGWAWRQMVGWGENHLIPGCTGCPSFVVPRRAARWVGGPHPRGKIPPADESGARAMGKAARGDGDEDDGDEE